MRLLKSTFILFVGTFATILLFYGNGFAQVSFLPYTAIPTGSWPEVTAIADLNNDGLNDVVLGTSYYFDSINDYKLFVFYQNAAGNLGTPIKYPYPHAGSLAAITTGDFNNDGLKDVAIGYGDSIGIFFQNTSGTLNTVLSFYSGSPLYGIKAGDLNNDGLNDIAVLHFQSISLFYQNTSGGFIVDTLQGFSSGYREIEVGDVNNDNLDDIIFISGISNSTIIVYTQNAAGGFNNFLTYTPPVSTFSQLKGIAIGDLNSDGRGDIVATGNGNSPYSRIIIWYQDPISGLLQSPVVIPAYDVPEPVEVSDLNCDGKNEIIVCHGGWDAVSVFEQDILSNINSYQTFFIPYASHYEPEGLSVGDYNNDGKTDLAIADYNSGLICLYGNNALSCNPSSVNNFVRNEKKVNTYPNPSDGKFIVQFNEDFSEKTIRIFDATGSIIYQKEKIKSAKQEINLVAQPKGFYFIKVFYGDKIEVSKIVLQ